MSTANSNDRSVRGHPSITVPSLKILSSLIPTLERRISARPDDVDALRQLGNTRRAIGDLAGAAEAYGAVASLRPNDHLADLMKDLTVGIPVSGFGASGPSPYRLIPELLSADDREAAWEIISELRGELTEARSGLNGIRKVRPDNRVGLSIERQVPEILALMVPRLFSAMEAFGAADHFQLPRLDPDRTRSRVGCYLEGGYYKPHRDVRDGWPRPSLTFIYYLIRDPSLIDGGNLVLHDDPAAGCTRIQPRDNLLVLFPPDRLHEVDTVHCTGTDVLDGRLAIHGWIHPASRD